MAIYRPYNGTPNTDCYWVGAVLNLNPIIRGLGYLASPSSLQAGRDAGERVMRVAEEALGIGFRAWGLGFGV